MPPAWIRGFEHCSIITGQLKIPYLQQLHIFMYVYIYYCMFHYFWNFTKTFLYTCIKRFASVTLLKGAVLGYFSFLFAFLWFFMFFYFFYVCSSISSHIKFGTDVFLYSYGNKTEKILGLGLKMFLCFFFRERFSISLKLFNVYSWSFGQIFVYYPGMLYWYGMLPFPWNHLWFLGSF